MIDALKERKYVNELGRARVYTGLATLQKDGMVRARWGLPENPEEQRRYFQVTQVTEDGNRERSKVPVISNSGDLFPGLIPLPEPVNSVVVFEREL